MQKLSMGDIIILVVISALADRVGASRKGDFFYRWSVLKIGHIGGNKSLMRIWLNIERKINMS